MKLRWVIKYNKMWVSRQRYYTYYYTTADPTLACKFRSKAEATEVAARELRLSRGYAPNLVRITARPFRRRRVRAVTPQPAE